MNISGLTPTVQTLIMVNFEMFGKLFILGVFFLVSIYYLTQVHGQKKTPYITMSFINMLAYMGSYACIVFLPLFILVLYPTVELGLLLAIFFYAYGVLMIVVVIFFIINLFYYSPLLMLKMGGLDFSISEKDNLVLNRLEKMLGLNKVKTKLWGPKL